MALTVCPQWLTTGWNATRDNLSYAVYGAAGAGYQGSNYLLGGVFREIVMGKPSHTDLTKKACQDLLDPDIHIDKPSRYKVLDAFKMYTQEFKFQAGRASYLFNVKIYESLNGQDKHTCVRVGGKDETADVSDIRVYPLLKAYVKTDRAEDRGLRILQVSLHDHQIKQGEGSWQTWKPTEAREVSRIFFAFLKELKESNIDVDSLMCHSLGSIVLEDLDSDDAILPQLLILDRALPSLWKVGCKLHYLITASLIYGGAYAAGWATKPETRIMQFFANPAQQMSLSGRKVVLVQVGDDFYFSGPGAFSSEFTDDLNKMGVEAHQKCFHPNIIAYHARTHHALPLNKLKNGRQKDEVSTFPLKPYENAASGIVNYLMLPDIPK